MNAVALARISSDKQDRELSLPAQVTLLSEYAERRKLALIETFQIIESSTTGDRRKFKNVIRFCAGQPGRTALLIDTIDRAQRSFMEIPLMEEHRLKGTIEFHFIRENIVIRKESTSTEILMWHQGVLMAQAYSMNFKENVRRSVKEKIAKGGYPGQAPIGYLNIRTEGDRGDIVLDEVRAPIIKKLFNTYASGNTSLKELVKLAADWGLTNKSRGKKPLDKSHIWKTLCNSFYYGLANWGGVSFEHKHPRLIDKAVWDKCRMLLHGHAKSSGKWGSREFLYRGLIRDHYTGRIITTERHKDKYNYLMAWTADGRQKAIPEDDVSGQIYKILKSIQIPRDAVAEILDSLKTAKQNELVYHQQAVSDLQRDLRQTERRLAALLDLLIDGKIEHDIWQKKDRELKDHALETRNRIGLHEQGDGKVNDTIVAIFQAVSDAADIWAKLTGVISATRQSGAPISKTENIENSAEIDKKSSEVACLRDMLSAIFLTLELKDGTLRFSLQFPFSEFLKKGKKEDWWG